MNLDLINIFMKELKDLYKTTPDALLDEDIELLNEMISLRTGIVATGLAQTKAFANKSDQEVRSLKDNANKISNAKDVASANKSIADAMSNIANLFHYQRKMTIYTAITASATAFGTDKSTKLLQKLTQTRGLKRRRR